MDRSFLTPAPNAASVAPQHPPAGFYARERAGFVIVLAILVATIAAVYIFRRSLPEVVKSFLHLFPRLSARSRARDAH